MSLVSSSAGREEEFDTVRALLDGARSFVRSVVEFFRIVRDELFPPGDCCEAIKLVAFAGDDIAHSVLWWRRRALKAIEKALRIAPNFYVAWYLRGVVYGDMVGRRFSEDLLEEALKSFDKSYDPVVSRNWPNKYLPFFAKGKLLYEVSRFERAFEEFDKALKLADDWEPTEIILRRSLALYQLGMLEESVDDAIPILTPLHYDELIELAGEHASLYGLSEVEARALVLKAVAETMCKEFRRGKRTIDSLLSKSRTPEALTIYAQWLKGKGRRDEALGVLLGIPRDRRPIVALRLLWSIYSEKRDTRPIALKFIEEALSRRPDSFHLRFVRCETLKDIGGLKMSEECYKSIVEDCRGFKNYFCSQTAYQLAYLLEVNKRFDEAEEYYKRSIALMQFPDSDVYYSYADLLEKVFNRVDEAIEYYRLAARYGRSPMDFGASASALSRLGLIKEALINYFKALVSQIGSTYPQPFRVTDIRALKDLIRRFRRSGEDCCDVIGMIDL